MLVYKGKQRDLTDEVKYVHLWVCDNCYEAIYLDEYYEPFHICNPKTYISATQIRREEKKKKRRNIFKELKDSIKGE